MKKRILLVSFCVVFCVLFTITACAEMPFEVKQENKKEYEEFAKKYSYPVVKTSEIDYGDIRSIAVSKDGDVAILVYDELKYDTGINFFDSEGNFIKSYYMGSARYVDQRIFWNKESLILFRGNSYRILEFSQEDKLSAVYYTDVPDNDIKLPKINYDGEENVKYKIKNDYFLIWNNSQEVIKIDADKNETVLFKMNVKNENMLELITLCVAIIAGIAMAIVFCRYLGNRRKKC